ncbi:MAG: thiamine pyrophosphate-dependent dehydrogenase E1 component subunit alpha [Pseudomonadota bacterium]
MTAANYDTARGTALLEMMERIRAFERQAELAAIRDQLVLGAIHLSLGQEASAAGVIAALRRDDLLLSTHRGHGHTLAKGADPTAMMAELLGRETGCCGGKGGSMHIADFDVGMLGANGVVSANIPIGAGAAHGIKLLGDDRIVVNFFGDGAINRGPFLEGLNWAAVFELPVLFVCEDNEWSATTRTATMTAGAGAAARAQSLGLRSESVDGNDVEAVADLARDLVDAIRNSRQPAFLHARTFRQSGHTYFDPASYRSQAETQARIDADDPIERQRETLQGAGLAKDQLDAIRQAAEAEMVAALEAAKAAAFPPDESVFADVQDIGSPEREAF